MADAEPRGGMPTPLWPRRRRVAARAMLIAAPLPLLACPLGARLAGSTHLVILRRAFDGPVDLAPDGGRPRNSPVMDC